MDRRRFISLSGAGLVSLTMSDWLSPLSARVRRKEMDYNMILLGDTHFDTEPADVYHSNYMEKVDWLNKVQRAEFKRNGEMWRERCPRLMNRAADLIDKDTRMTLQMGDLIQGDCGKGEVHQQMLSDVMNSFKEKLNGLPFVTVVGNHDIRGTQAKEVYHSFMPKQMSRELGLDIQKTTFAFWQGPDVYIVIDFNHPDDEEIERLFEESQNARYTFVMVHGPLMPADSKGNDWFFHGRTNETERRHHFRQLFAKREVICLCGHTHKTDLMDWYGDGGRITQLTVNSVWSKDKLGNYEVEDEGPENYGRRVSILKNDDGSPLTMETDLVNDYKEGLKTYIHSSAAGSYKLYVGRKGVFVDFYAGDSKEPSTRFKLR